MRINRASVSAPVFTHAGARAKHITPEQQLNRSVMSCMLWEDNFYEDGKSIAERIIDLTAKVDPQFAADTAVAARTKFKLRHVPLLITRVLAKGNDKQRAHVAALLDAVIQRPDELAEFLALYWKEKKQPLSAQVKKGLAKAFTKFSSYQLQKYDREHSIKLRDVMFMVHPKPKNKAQEKLFKQLADRKMESADTWEVALSSGADKKETFTRLIGEKKLGALALLRNLRNMIESNVPEAEVRRAITTMKTERVLPFRFLTAAKYAPKFEPELEEAMLKCLDSHAKLPGKTALLIDGSGSMFGQKISAKSELDRFDAAVALAILVREICDNVEIICFSDSPQPVQSNLHGFALKAALYRAAQQSSTQTERAKRYADTLGYDRIIIITDEQSHQTLSSPPHVIGSGTVPGYVINVAPYQNGIGYGAWTHIDGWSEAIIDFIVALEQPESVN